MVGTLTLEGEAIGDVKLGDTLLPGVFQRMDIRTSLRMPEESASGRSGSTKLPQGWAAAEVTLDLICCSDDERSAGAKLDVISQLFGAADAHGRPRIYNLVHWHCLARGIRQVVFKELSSSDDSESDLVACSLLFVQHRPPQRKVEARRRQTPTTGFRPAAASAPGTAGQTSADWLGQGITIDPSADADQSFFAGGAGGIDVLSGEGLVQLSALDAGRPSVDEDSPA
jgi:hypothetical protein